MPSITRPDGAQIYYEVHGEGDPLLCVGGWGSFCHGATKGLPFGLTEHFTVVILDYRGLGDSTDNPDTDPTMEMYADDCIAVLEHLSLSNVHLLGMVGIGACICQSIAIRRPDLSRTLVNTGAWARADRMLADQLRLFVDVHRDAGFPLFQRLVCSLSFEPAFYDANIDRLLGPNGPWHHLIGKIATHDRFVTASLVHDTVDDLKAVATPALIVHAPLDVVTGPRVTVPIEESLPNSTGIFLEGAAHVIAGKEMRQRFSNVLFDFYGRM